MTARASAMILTALGLVMVFSNIRDEIRGKTKISSGGRTSMAFMGREVSKDDPKSNFRGAMAYHWFMAVGFLGAGWFSFSLSRHYDRHDLLSTKFESTGEE